MSHYYRVDLSREACRSEEEYKRVKKISDIALQVFKVDFRYEFRYLHGDAPAPQPPPGASCVDHDPLDLKEDIENTSSSTFKKLRNELAKIFHPDTQDDDNSREFKEIQTAFEDGNFTKLIDKAVENEIDIKLSDSDVILLKSIIDKQNEYISSKTSAAEWFWYYSDRKTINRGTVWSAMNINEDGFKNWMSSNNYSVDVLEAECVARLSVDPVVENKEEKFNEPRHADKLMISS